MDPTSPNYDSTVDFEFNDPAWICPNVTQIQLSNNPSLVQSVSGLSFTMVVNECKIAKAKGDEQMLELGMEDVTYSEQECSPLPEHLSTNNFLIWTKIMTQSFNNPKKYRKSGLSTETYFTSYYKTQLNVE